jgi:multisubunit Na+/H+ antiporter MnhG subunit
MAIIGVGLAIWLFQAGFVKLGCLGIGVFLWRSRQFAAWLIVPASAPSDGTPPLRSKWQRILLSTVCLFGAAVCALGIYLWRWWPEEWQAGLVFILLGMLVLAPVTIQEIRSRKKALTPAQPTTAE